MKSSLNMRRELLVSVFISSLIVRERIQASAGMLRFSIKCLLM